MFRKALLALAAVIALAALGIGVLAHGPAATAAWSGAALGLLCAVTAVAGAAFALHEGLGAKGALSVVVGGMLFRIVLVSAWAVVAFRVYSLKPIPFLIGLAAIYLPCQVIELAMLRSIAPRRAR